MSCTCTVRPVESKTRLLVCHGCRTGTANRSDTIVLGKRPAPDGHSVMKRPRQLRQSCNSFHAQDNRTHASTLGINCVFCECLQPYMSIAMHGFFVCALFRLLLDPFHSLVRNIALGDTSVEKSAEMAASICKRFGDTCAELKRLSSMAFSKHAERDFLRYMKQVRLKTHIHVYTMHNPSDAVTRLCCHAPCTHSKYIGHHIN